MPSLNPTARANRAEKLRIAAARSAKHVAAQNSNGDESLYPEKWGNYSKGLAHDARGDVKPSSYTSLSRALKTGTAANFDKIRLGGSVALADPQAGLTFSLEGGDPQSFELDPAPALASAWRAGEAVENYWMALLRDVPFDEYHRHPLARAAITDLNRLSDFRGPKLEGMVTARTLFRGSTTGDLIGPYVSQFLLLPFDDGAIRIDQWFQTTDAGLDYMTEFAAWLATQNGQATMAPAPVGLHRHMTQPRHLRDGRGLAAYAHGDISFGAFLNACSVVRQHARAPACNEGTPYRSGATPTGFAAFGLPYAKSQIAAIAAPALKAAWFQKWFVHRVLRPEAYAALVHKTILPVSRRLHKVYPVHADVLNADAVQRTLIRYTSALLPQAYPEGSPLYPSYAGGHGTVAAACATLLKAIFDENTPIANPKMPIADDAAFGSDALTDYTGSDRELLTVGGEANKLAANIALGRGHAGVNFRSDYQASLTLGEEVAIRVLRDQKVTYHESVSWKFTRFDGTSITI